MMLILVGVIAWSVFGRQVLRISVPWSEEIGAGLLAWMVMLGSAARLVAPSPYRDRRAFAPGRADGPLDP